MSDRTQPFFHRSLNAIRAHRWIIVAATAVAMGVAAISNHAQVPRYQAYAQVQVSLPGSLPDSGGGPPAQADDARHVSQYLETEREKLNSSALRALFAEQMQSRGSRGLVPESITGELQKNMRVEPVEGTNLIKVCFTAADPEKASEWLNRYLDLAVEGSSRQREEAANPERRAIRAQLAEIRNLMTFQQRQIHSYTDGLSGNNEEVSLADLKRAYEDAVKKKTEAQQRLARLEPYLMPGADLRGIPDFEFAPNIKSWADKVDETNEILGVFWAEGVQEEQLESLAADLELQNYQDQLRAEIAKTAEGLRSNMSLLKAEEQSALSRYLRAASEQSGSQNAPELPRLQEALAKLSKAAAALESRLSGVSHEEIPSLSIAGRATPDFNPVSKRGLPFVLLAGCVAFVLSTGTVVVREGIRAEVSPAEPPADAREMEASFSLVPQPRNLIFNEIRKSYDSLRTLLARTQHYRTLVITSSLPREGKTTVALNLARTLAASGDRTVLLDFDLRKARAESGADDPELQSRSRTFSPVEGLNLCLQTTDCRSLHIIVPAEAPQGLPYIFSHPEIEELIRYLRSHYQWVLIDTPPMTSAKDALILASMVDAVLFVIKDDFVDKKIVKSSMAALDGVHAKILGAVINDFGLNRTVNDPFRYLSGIPNVTRVTERPRHRLIQDAFQHSRNSLAYGTGGRVGLSQP